MIFRLDRTSGEITEVTSDEARRVLSAHWSKPLVDEFFRSAKVLYTPTAYFSRIKSRLEELTPDVKPELKKAA